MVANKTAKTNVRCEHGRPQGGKTGIFPLEIETKQQDFLENMKLTARFRLIYLIFVMPLYLPV